MLRKVEKKELNIWQHQQETEIPDIEEDEMEVREEYDGPVLINTNLENILKLRRKLNPHAINEIVRDFWFLWGRTKM